MTDSIRTILQHVLPEIDDSTLDYFESMVADMNSDNNLNKSTLVETLVKKQYYFDLVIIIVIQ